MNHDVIMSRDTGQKVKDGRWFFIYLWKKKKTPAKYTIGINLKISEHIPTPVIWWRVNVLCTHKEKQKCNSKY